MVGYSYLSLASMQEKIQQESHDAARQQARQWLLTLAEGQASEVARSFELALDAGETLAALLAGNVQQREPLNRDEVTALLKDIGDRNPDFLSIYSGWEADSFDGQDALHTGNGQHSQPSGNFAPYWSRGPAGFGLKPLGDFYSKTPSTTGISVATRSHAGPGRETRRSTTGSGRSSPSIALIAAAFSVASAKLSARTVFMYSTI